MFCVRAQALESIFVGSADIRVQLPEDSRRFDTVNADFQVRVRVCAYVCGRACVRAYACTCT